jgi:hypothetical protein
VHNINLSFLFLAIMTSYKAYFIYTHKYGFSRMLVLLIAVYSLPTTLKPFSFIHFSLIVIYACLTPWLCKDNFDIYN